MTGRLTEPEHDDGEQRSTIVVSLSFIHSMSGIYNASAAYPKVKVKVVKCRR